MGHRKMTLKIIFHFAELHRNEKGLEDYLSYSNLINLIIEE